MHLVEPGTLAFTLALTLALALALTLTLASTLTWDSPRFRPSASLERPPAEPARAQPSTAACANAATGELASWMRCEPVGGGPITHMEHLLFHVACFDAAAANSSSNSRRRGSRTLELFSMRRDGFASVVGSGQLDTRLLTVARSPDGGRGSLYVNGRPLKPGGQLLAAVQSAEGGTWRPIGHEPVREDATRHAVGSPSCDQADASSSQRGEANKGRWCDMWPRSFRLRFELLDFELFSFWIAVGHGHSYGHFTVGGPHYPDLRDEPRSRLYKRDS